VHARLQAPETEALGRPLRWFMADTATAVQRARGRRGHFWERRYRACLVDDDLYALAALRYLDRNPVRAGLVADPTTYPWSSCAAYALGTSTPLVPCHPSYLALSPSATIRQQQDRALLAPSADPTTDARDPRWSALRAIGSAPVVARYTPPRGGRRPVPVPPQLQVLRG